MGERNVARWFGVRPTDPPETIPVSVAPPTGLVHVSASGIQYQAGTVVIYTVPAGKTLFLSSIQAGVGSTGNHVQTSARVRNATDAVQYYLFRTYGYGIMAFSIDRVYDPPKEIPAGWDIAFVGVAGADAGMVIDGWLE